MNIYFATTNSGKVKSLQRDLMSYNIIQESIDLTEPRSSDVKEIAEVKIKEAYTKIQKPTIVIDAGFYISSLNGFPGAFVNSTLETIGIEGLLKLTEDKDRSCEFRRCIAYMDPILNEPQYFIDRTEGILSEQSRGIKQPHLWSDLSKIFIPKDHEKTLAEMTKEEYDSLGNLRVGNSIGKQLYEWLLEYRSF